MLHLAVLTFLQSAVYITVGEDLSYPSFPSIRGEEGIINPDWYFVGPVIPDTEPNFSFGAEYKTLPSLKNSSVSSMPSELSFSEWSSQTCNKRHAAIAYFANDFIERVMACEKLREAFQVQWFKAESLSSLVHDIVFTAHTSVGSPDADVSARVVRDAIALNFDKLKKDDFLRIIANAVGNYLFYRGYLSPSNFASLSQEYFTLTERSVNSIRNPSPEANIRALSEAFANFLISLGLGTKYSTCMITGVFSSQWYALGN